VALAMVDWQHCSINLSMIHVQITAGTTNVELMVSHKQQTCLNKCTFLTSVCINELTASRQNKHLYNIQQPGAYSKLYV